MKLRWGWCLMAGLLICLWSSRVQAGEVITVDKVIAMLDAKVDEATVMKICAMEGNSTQFDMTTDNIIKLKKASASEKLIAWMIEEATKEQREIQSDVQMFLNNARNAGNDTTVVEADSFRNSRQKVLAHGQKAIPVLVKIGLKRETSAKAKEAALGVIYELLTPDYVNPELVEQLQQHLVADDTAVRYASAHAYSVIANQQDLDTCFDTILKQHPIYTDGYVMVLAYSRNGNSIPKLIGLMENSDAEVRRVAAFGIGYQHFIQKKEPSADTLTLLSSQMLAQTETTEVRIACAKAIADMGVYDDDMLTKVIQAATRYPDSRPSMVYRMADFTKNNFLLLQYLVEDALEDTDDPRVVDAANSALRRLTKRNDNTVAQWRNWWRSQKLVLKMQKASAPETPREAPAPELPAPAPAPAGHPTGTGTTPPADGGTVVNPAPVVPPGTGTAPATTPATTTTTTVPPASAPIQDLTPAQRDEVYTHLLQAAKFNKSTSPLDWDTVIGHYEAALKIVRPLGETNNWNLQFKSDLSFAQSYKQGLVLMQAKNYPDARKAFEACDKIGFSREFTGVQDRLKEIDAATAKAQGK